MIGWHRSILPPLSASQASSRLRHSKIDAHFDVEGALASGESGPALVGIYTVHNVEKAQEGALQGEFTVLVMV